VWQNAFCPYSRQALPSGQIQPVTHFVRAMGNEAVMDKSTLLGLVLGVVTLYVGIIMGGSLKQFIDVHGGIIIFGGAAAALFIMFPLKKVLSLPSILKNCFFVRLPDAKETIKQLSEMSATVRRDGLLALEKKLSEIKDPFFVRGLEMVIDGAPREKLEDTLGTELACVQERHASGKKQLEFLGATFPAFGMVATLIGLVQMLGQLEDPSKIGAGMAVAMVATFYGAAGSNLIFLPLAGKLEQRSKEETLVREIMITGLVSLVEGEAPRAMETKLKAYLSPKARQDEAKATAA
jgi:chemotaxis protein MotA